MDARTLELAGALIGLGGTITNAMDADPDFTPCRRPAGIVMGNVAALGENLPDEEYAARTEQVLALMEHVGEHHGATVAGAHDASALTAEQEELLSALIELTATTLPKLEADVFSPEVNAFFYRSLATLAGDGSAVEGQLAKLASVQELARSL